MKVWLDGSKPESIDVGKWDFEAYTLADSLPHKCARTGKQVYMEQKSKHCSHWKWCEYKGFVQGFQVGGRHDHWQ